VDWSRTRAYCLGLSGLFLNVRDREAQGIVEPGAEAGALRAELCGKLSGLRDAEKDAIGIAEAFDTRALYAGPYLENAPDVILGYNRGYRVSWDCATGVVAGPVFEDNTRAWSGDHCIDPRLVPGVFFCNRAVETGAPGLVDIAPTVLSLFGVDPPKHMDGRVLAIGEPRPATTAAAATLPNPKAAMSAPTPPAGAPASPKKPAARRKRRAS
jgi:predicted AlkP superfamily phosphohydrolase/phosphomutase